MSFPLGSLQNTAATSQPLAITYDTTISSDTTVTLNAATVAIEVTAISKPIFVNWDAAASTSAFIGIIDAGTTKIFTVPRGVATAHFIEAAASATLVCIEF